MSKLSVNINKIALLRNSRGSNLPDLERFALDCIRFGADGITVHPRPDERHIRYADVYALKAILPQNIELNVEGYPEEQFIKLIQDVKPAQVTLVPDKPGALTSNAGWDTLMFQTFLTNVLAKIPKFVRVSLFMNPDLLRISAIQDINSKILKVNQDAARVDRIEFYTGPYAEFYPYNPEKAIAPYIEAAKMAKEVGLGLNAGHDLNLENLSYLKNNLDNLLEVSIGHALISDALYFGIESTIQKYQSCLGKNQTN